MKDCTLRRQSEQKPQTSIPKVDKPSCETQSVRGVLKKAASVTNLKETSLLQGGTYGGSILGCAAANATIDAIEEDGMLDNARDRGVQLVQVSVS